MWLGSLETEKSAQRGEPGFLVGIVMQPRRSQDPRKIQGLVVGHQRGWLSKRDADSNLERDLSVLSAKLVHGPLGSADHRDDPVKQEPLGTSPSGITGSHPDARIAGTALVP